VGKKACEEVRVGPYQSLTRSENGWRGVGGIARMTNESRNMIPTDNIVTCDNVNDFLNQIYPASGMGNDCHKRWIFRGQPAGFNLTPSAFRGETLSVLTRWFYGKPSPESQISLELRALGLFLEAVDRQGILVPGDSREFREKWINKEFILSVDFRNSSNLDFWPDKNGVHVLTFAQHSGLPTRLLDWTRRSYIAAYFAATGTAKKAIYEQDEKEPNEDIAVWAFSDEFIDRYKEPEIEIVDVPTGLNQNLVLQRGCFTLVKTPVVDECPRYFTFEEAASLNNDKFGGVFPLRKFVLRSGQRRRLLKRLSECEGIDGASMFSGVDGAMKFIKEQAYWFSA